MYYDINPGLLGEGFALVWPNHLQYGISRSLYYITLQFFVCEIWPYNEKKNKKLNWA